MRVGKAEDTDTQPLHVDLRFVDSYQTVILTVLALQDKYAFVRKCPKHISSSYAHFMILDLFASYSSLK